ncbi:MAG TPA: carboxypeptidase-like regulatory domain-containing protein [Terriglobia bacterium]|nr:carboxypeptidase-like regulatory domain-containing protein [Terriglobia bacterium]
MTCRRAALATLFCFAVILVGSPLFGQATGTLSGTVQDRSGAALPGAAVTATSQETGVPRETKTDGTGHFLLPLLPIGTYSIKVTAAGFQPVEQKDLTLQVDETREVDFSLAPATLQQTVEVSATAVAVETANATLGQVITSQQVAELPLNGRDFVQLATLGPGTVSETNPNSFFTTGGSSEVAIRGSFSLSVGGSRANSTDWLLDGVDNNELTAGGIAILPDIDALQEFKVLTYDYSAEYGTRGGPTVLLTTKSGSNDFHGSLFEFLRNTSLDARDFFAPNRGEFKQNQFGGTLGGPIKKDKTFFFLDYQGKRSLEGITFLGTVPTAKERTGDFSEAFLGISQLYNPYSTTTVGGVTTRQPFMCDAGGNPLPTNANGIQAAGTACNKIPASLINPIAAQMANLYPSPNIAGTLVNDYSNVPVRNFKEGEADLRLDHNFSSRDSLYARFSYDQATDYQPGGSPGFAEAGAFASTQSLADHSRNAALSETHVFSPNTLNKVTAGFNRDFNHILSYGTGSCESQKLGIPGANLGGVSCGLVSTEVSGAYWPLGDRGYTPFQGGTNVFSISDSFDMIRGKHEMTFGGQIRANQMNVLAEGFQDGFWIFTNGWTASPAGAGGDNMADFLLGLADLALHDQNFQGPTTGRRWKMYRPYFQDNWRVSPNLTVNLGLAWAIVTPISEEANRESNFDYQTGQWFVAGRNSGSHVGVATDLTAFEPRLGIAWSPRGDRKTSVRLGYSIYHDSSWNQGAQGLWQNPPYWEESANGSFFADGNLTPAQGYNISQGFAILTEPPGTSGFGGNWNAQNLNFKQGRIQQFNLNIERQLPGDVLLTVGYAGARSNHLLSDDFNVNIGSPTACGTVSGYTLGCGAPPAPWGGFTDVYDIFDNGHSRYDSLQVRAETKSSHGLYGLVSYTYSKDFDSGMPDGLGSNIGALYYPLPGAATMDKGFSQIDLTHNFTASVVYDLPFGKGKHWGSNWAGATNALFGGWELTVIEHAISGFPLFIYNSNNTSGVNFQWNGLALNRPDRVCNGRLSNWTVSEFFNTSCFQAAASGELGNSDRTPLFGPPLVNTDFSAIKNIPLSFREGASLQFRAEFFNLWNHPEFATPTTDLAAGPVFGVINQSVNNPRLIQFALKLRF